MKNLKPICAAVLVLFAVLACSRFTSSPTATFKAFYEAQKKKDVEGMKKTLSKGSMAMLEKGIEFETREPDLEAAQAGYDAKLTASSSPRLEIPLLLDGEERSAARFFVPPFFSRHGEPVFRRTAP